MLVLSRKMGERITIGEQIEVVVVRIKGDAVKLGIEAPRETPVWRIEIKPAGKEASDGKAA